jgi:hypothetical protein
MPTPDVEPSSLPRRLSCRAVTIPSPHGRSAWHVADRDAKAGGGRTSGRAGSMHALHGRTSPPLAPSRSTNLAFCSADGWVQCGYGWDAAIAHRDSTSNCLLLPVAAAVAERQRGHTLLYPLWCLVSLSVLKKRRTLFFLVARCSVALSSNHSYSEARESSRKVQTDPRFSFPPTGERTGAGALVFLSLSSRGAVISYVLFLLG